MERYPKQLCHVQGCPLWEGAVGGSVLALPVPPKPAHLGFCLWIKGEGSRQRPGEAGSVMQGRQTLCQGGNKAAWMPGAAQCCGGTGFAWVGTAQSRGVSCYIVLVAGG